jgi:UDP-2,3-diacylglucosamine hydrolase
MTMLFLSDLHLSRDTPLLATLFESFLSRTARSASAIYILGDLFEYWAGDDDLDDSFNSRIVAGIRACSNHVPVNFMHGNRDFLIGPAFAEASGATIVADPLVMDLNGIRTLIMHGDSLCTDDTGYQAFRKMVRSADWKDRFLALPLADRKAQIAALRAQSESEKRVKSMEIHGHTHRPAVHRFELDGVDAERWVLADWRDEGSYLACRPDAWHSERITAHDT